ncbi:DUF559 domain-containing protein [Herbihabitans rhizosphaerae]|nr:DUF559 domain-containing protein [Herbihabitans rhizosphaerae]
MTDLPPSRYGVYVQADLASRIGRSAVGRLINRGELVRYCRGVLIQRRQAGEFRARACAALTMVGPDAVLTSHTAAYLHGCTAADPGAVHVLVGYGRKLHRRHIGLVVHHGRFEPSDVVEVDGLRVLALDKVIADLLCRSQPGTALACADQALALAPRERKAELWAEIDARIADRDDPRGRRRGATLLDLATGLPESPAESWLLLILFDAGLPLPEPQHEVHDRHGRVLYRLDFAWTEARLALEYDGYEAHLGREVADAARATDLRRRGWTVVRAAADDLRDPTRMINELRDALRFHHVAA